MNWKPLWTATIICSLFCLPRMVTDGGAITSNRILIRIPAAGLSAAQVRDSVESVVIDSLSSLKNELSLQSISRPAELLVSAGFSLDTPTVDMLTRIQRRLFATRNRLPYQAGLPVLIPLDLSEPFLSVSANFSDSVPPHSLAQKKLEAEQLQEELRRSGLVRRASVQGVADQELAVYLDPETLVQREIAPQYISEYLRQCLFDYYAGSWHNRQYSREIQLCSTIRSRKDLEKLQIPLPAFTKRPKTLLLGDIAEIQTRTLPPRHSIYGGDFLISLYTAPGIQLHQQIALYKQLCATLKKNDAVSSWQLCGGHFFSAVRYCAVLAALFCIGLLLTLAIASSLPDSPLGGSAAAAARLYSLAWALHLLGCVLGQYPVSLSALAGCALAGLLAAPFCRPARCPARKPVRTPVAWLLCAVLAGALLFRALWVLPQARVYTIELPSEQLATEYCRKHAHVCGVLSRPHEFRRTENAREYWESCAHPNRLVIRSLAADLETQNLRPRFPPSRRQPASLSIALNLHARDTAPVARREIHSQIDLALNGRVVGELPSGPEAALRMPVRLFYGHLQSPADTTVTTPAELQQLPVFINARKALRLELLCRLHISKQAERQ